MRYIIDISKSGEYRIIDTNNAQHIATAFMRSKAEFIYNKLNNIDENDLLGGALCDSAEQSKPIKYLCTLCKINSVDAENGFDTCQDCIDSA